MQTSDKFSKFSWWQILLCTMGNLSMAIALSAFPVWADERQNASSMEPHVSSTSEEVEFDSEAFLEELQESSELFASEQIPTVADMPVYSTQAKDILVQNTTEPATEPTVNPIAETTTEPATETTTKSEVDTSGTNPAVFNRELNFTSEYIKVPTGNYLLATNFNYTEPFADNRMSFRFRVPVVATDVLGRGRFGIGDVQVKWNWVADINPKTAVVVASELYVPTASDRVLGTGKWVLAPSLIYAFFIDKNIIIAPAYVHNFSFTGDSDRADIHRGDFDLYMVYTADDKSWWVTSDLGISFDYQTGKTPAFWKVQYGRNLAKLAGGVALNGFIKPGIGIGGDRTFDWSFQVGLALIGF
ncbi:MAG: hypothetical protein HC856_04210 [Pseudanabaena sp. RU_4_16]|nr:hypothetical protein [Pseudanabaena sp. RU_4_16]